MCCCKSEPPCFLSHMLSHTQTNKSSKMGTHRIPVLPTRIITSFSKKIHPLIPSRVVTTAHPLTVLPSFRPALSHTNTHRHVAIKNNIFIIISIQTGDKAGKESPQNCCLGNSKEYSLVAMTTDDAHPVWLVDFYLYAWQGADCWHLFWMDIVFVNVFVCSRLHAAVFVLFACACLHVLKHSVLAKCSCFVFQRLGTSLRDKQ